MNSDQIKGTAKDAMGKVQQETGKLFGNKKQQIKGIAKQQEGKLQKSAGDVEEMLKEASRKKQ
jgi:uncharacterized protein YjbJ (UPF0337 family)